MGAGGIKLRRSDYTVAIKITDEEHLLFHGYSGAVDIVDANIAGALSEGDLKELSSDVLQKLRKRGYVTDKSPEEEQELVKKMAVAMHKSRKPPSFMLILSYDCNLRCIYCYQQRDHLKNRDSCRFKTITPELIDKAFNVMDKLVEEFVKESKADLDSKPCVGLYGGEPFLIHNYEALRYAVKKGKELGYTFSAITNGTQIDKFLDLLESPALFRGFQITLDGPEEIHNRRRIYPGGEGSFSDIARNVSTLLKLGYSIDLRVNVDGHNIKYLKQLDEFITSQGWNRYRNFRAYCSVVRLKGGKRVIDEMILQQAISELPRDSALRSIPHPIYRIFRKVFEQGGLIEFGINPCGAVAGQLIFDPFGDLYTCWDIVGCSEHKVGRYYPVLKFNRKLDEWRNRTVANIPECLKCPYLFLCKGGCAQYAYFNSGSIYSPFCDQFPQMFEYQVKLAYCDFRLEQMKTSLAAQEGLVIP